MSSQEMARRESQVPDLVRTPANTLTASDIAIPRINVSHYSSGVCQQDLVRPGELYSHFGKDDADPAVLWSPWKDKEFVPEGGLRAHVLGLRKGWSYREVGDDDLQRWAFDDSSRHPDSWLTYDYTLFVPDAERDLPYKFLLTRTSMSAARQVNTVLTRGASSGPEWTFAFEFSTAKKENNKGRWFIAVARQVEALPADVKEAEALASMLYAGNAQSPTRATAEPEI